VYRATIAFGAETDTDDVTGTVTRRAGLPDASRVREGISELTGSVDQVPPAYSAKQVEGRRAYTVARRGEALTLAPVRVTVHTWEIRAMSDERLDTIITCGSGTYIRALARDLGRRCDSAAHLASLRRTRSGSFDVANAMSIEEVRAGNAAPEPARAAVAHLPAITLSADDVRHVRQGRTIAAERSGRTAALVDAAGALVAIAESVAERWQPRVVLPDA